MRCELTFQICAWPQGRRDKCGHITNLFKDNVHLQNACRQWVKCGTCWSPWAGQAQAKADAAQVQANRRWVAGMAGREHPPTGEKTVLTDPHHATTLRTQPHDHAPSAKRGGRTTFLGGRREQIAHQSSPKGTRQQQLQVQQCFGAPTPSKALSGSRLFTPRRNSNSCRCNNASVHRCHKGTELRNQLPLHAATATVACATMLRRTDATKAP